MSTNQIQSFLNSKLPSCDTNGTKPYGGTTRANYGTSKGYPPPYTCLKDYSQTIPTVTNSGSDLCKGSISGGTKSASQIINDVAKACQTNPKVLLVLLQKEQSLVTDDWPWSIQYRSATGYGCPDTAPCDSEYYGFLTKFTKRLKPTNATKPTQITITTKPTETTQFYGTQMPPAAHPMFSSKTKLPPVYTSTRPIAPTKQL